MGRILDTEDGVFVSDTTRPVNVNGVVLSSVRDAAVAYGLSESEVAEAANTGKSAKSGRGTGATLKISWPDLSRVQTEWPDLPTVKWGSVRAKPCTIHFKMNGKRAKTYNVDVRSITATRRYLGLTETKFDAIAHRLPGWQTWLPKFVDGITIHEPGYKPKNPQAGDPRRGPYFAVKQMKGGIQVTPVFNSFELFEHISDVPDFVIQNA